jgi:hypothetical protein
MSMPPKQQDESLGGCVAALVIGGVAGLPVGGVLLAMLESLFQPSSRSCPHGWGALGFAAAFVIGGFFLGKFKGKVLGSFCAGVGSGISVVGGICVWWYKAMPSC